MSAESKEQKQNHDEHLRSTELPWPITKEMIENSPYQLMPPLTAEERDGLECQIVAEGVTDPVVFDSDGNPLDGHNRLQICLANDISDYPCIIKHGLSEQEKRGWLLRKNLWRRHLTEEQKREICAAQLREAPHFSNRWTGEIVGMDHKTVEPVRMSLIASGDIEDLDATVGKDGRWRQRATGKAKSKAPKPGLINKGADDTPAAAQRDDGSVTGSQIEELADDDCRLMAGTIADATKALAPESVQLVVCDNPLAPTKRRTADVPAKRRVAETTLQHYGEVGRLAAHCLRRDGTLVVPVESWALDQVIGAISPHIPYYQTITRLHRDIKLTAGNHTSGGGLVLIFSPTRPNETISKWEEYELGEITDKEFDDFAILYSDGDAVVLYVNPSPACLDEPLSWEKRVVAVYPAGTDLEAEMAKIMTEDAISEGDVEGEFMDEEVVEE
ncbi:MAG: ParB N-terminal domain-containing protein [Armatimonadota bacterium]